MKKLRQEECAKLLQLPCKGEEQETSAQFHGKEMMEYLWKELKVYSESLQLSLLSSSSSLPANACFQQFPNKFQFQEKEAVRVGGAREIPVELHLLSPR